jgi:predicted RND superfamily exporter protein
VYTTDIFSRYLVHNTPPETPDWAEITVFEKKVRKRSIVIMYDPSKITENEVAETVDKMILRLTRWGK